MYRNYKRPAYDQPREVDITHDWRSPTRDAAGRLRTSHPVTTFESKRLFDFEDVLKWSDIQVSGSGTSSTYNQNRASRLISVSANTAGSRVLQSKQWTPYQAGKGQVEQMTFVLAPAAAGITQEAGIFYADNGLFLRLAGTAASFVVRSKATGVVAERTFPSASWNIDGIDGHGPSRETLDLSKIEVLHIDFRWFSAGEIRFGFVIENSICYATIVDNANVLASAFMSTPNLPVRYQITNDGTGPASSLECICCAVISEGGRERSGLPRGADRGVTTLVVPATGAYYGVIAIRIDPTKPGASVRPESFCVQSEAAASYNWRVLLNPTVTGTALSWAAVANSTVQRAVPTNATTFSGGTVMDAGYGKISATGSAPPTKIEATDLLLGIEADASASDVLVLVVQTDGGVNVPFYGSLKWLEQV